MPTLDTRPIDLEQLRCEAAGEPEEQPRLVDRMTGLHAPDHCASFFAASDTDQSTDSVRPIEAGHVLGTLVNEGQAEQTLWQRLQEEHGLAVGYGRNGEINQIYENFWAARYRYEQPVIFDEERGTFYLYEAGVYREASEDRLRRGVAALMLRLKRLLGLDGLEKFRNARSLNGVLTTLRGQVAERDPFGRDERRFVILANGVLLLDENGESELVTHNPSYRSTHAVAIDYEPQAECPRFKRELLASMLPSPADRYLVQTYFGMALLGCNLAQRLLILRGDGNDGKSQLVNVLTGLLGPEATLQLRTEHLG